MELDEGYGGAAALALAATGDHVLGERLGLTYSHVHDALELSSRLATTFAYEFGMPEAQVRACSRQVPTLPAQHRRTLTQLITHHGGANVLTQGRPWFTRSMRKPSA